MKNINTITPHNNHPNNTKYKHRSNKVETDCGGIFVNHNY